MLSGGIFRRCDTLSPMAALDPDEKKLIPLSETNIKSFWSKVKKVDGGCWLWGNTPRAEVGFGQFNVRQPDGNTGSSELAHRFSYRASKGEILSGYVISQTCRNRLCVRPDHLELAPRPKRGSYRLRDVE